MKRGLSCLLLMISIISAFAILRNSFGQEIKYPTRPIQVVIPSGPGGTLDIVARITGGQLQEVLNTPIIHLNKPGGGGITGAVFVKEQKPDGYNILHAASAIIESTIVTPNCPYKKEDFIPIARVTYGALVLSVKKDAPWKTIEEFIEAARKEPGKISVGVPGVGTLQHLVIKLFEMGAKIQLNPIPFKGDGLSVPPLLGGHIQGVMTGITTITPFLRSGEVRALVSSAPDRHPVFKDIPTFREKGFPEVALVSWTGAFVSLGTPEPIIKILNDAYREAANHPSVIALLEKAGTTHGYLNSDDFKKFTAGEYNKFYKASEAAGVIK